MTTENTTNHITENSVDFLYNFSNNIHVEENNENTLENINPESVAFVSIAEEKAMGVPNGVVIATEEGHNIKWYNFNLKDDKAENLKTVWPSFETFSVEKENFGLASGWNHIDLGLGNHLMIHDRYKDSFQKEIERLKPEHPGIIYAIWKGVAQVNMAGDLAISMHMKNIENAISNIMLYSGNDNFEEYIPHAIEAFHHAINNHETVIVPVALPKEALDMLSPDKIHQGDTMTLKQPMQFEMLTLQLNETETVAVAFTSRDELEKGDSVSSIKTDFEELLKGALENPEISGVILNPWSTGFVMTKDLIKMICDNGQNHEHENTNENNSEKLN